MVHGRPKTPKNTSFFGPPNPQGPYRPYILGDTTRPGHVTCVLVWSKSDRRRLRKTAQTNRQTNKQTNRHYENNGHLAVNQFKSRHDVTTVSDAAAHTIYWRRPRRLSRGHSFSNSDCPVWEFRALRTFCPFFAACGQLDGALCRCPNNPSVSVILTYYLPLTCMMTMSYTIFYMSYTILMITEVKHDANCCSISLHFVLSDSVSFTGL